MANHLEEIPGWVDGTLTQDSWDINPAAGEPYALPNIGSCEEILSLFDVNVEVAKKRFATTADEEYSRSWSLLSGGETLITMPKSESSAYGCSTIPFTIGAFVRLSASQRHSDAGTVRTVVG